MTTLAGVSFWDEIEPMQRQRAYDTLDADPQSLLETDSGGPSVKADIILARLVGMDGQIVKDAWRRPRIEPVLLLPVMRRPRLYEETSAPVDVSLPAQTYRLQSGFVLIHLDAEYAPPGVEVGRPRFDFSVLYLRYRHRI